MIGARPDSRPLGQIHMRILRSAALAVLCGLALAPVSARGQSLEADFGGLDEDQTDQAIEFVIGNAMFVLFHEAGHMLVSEFGLPVLGREEDAVDALSTLVMLEAEEEALEKALVDASDGWFLSAQQADEAGGDYAFWDEHSLDEQRAYSIVCLMVGKDAQKFSDVAEASEMPQERRDRCAFDYQGTSNNWSTVLAPHFRENEGETTVTMVYDEAEGDLASYAELVKEADFLGLLKTAIADQFKLEDGITFRAIACGQPNAFWSPSERTLTYCYELTQYHAALIVANLRDSN